MRNFIKYPSLKLKPRRGYCVPAGPSFRFAWKRRIDLLGSRLEFRAPGHAPAPNLWNEKTGPASHSYEGAGFRSCRLMPGEGWEEAPLFGRTWDFYGSWFVGNVARIYCYGSVLRPKQFRESMNFLHPRAFESAVLGYLTAQWGHEVDEDDGMPYQKAPVNWHPVKEMPAPAVILDMRKTKSLGGCNSRMLFFPISQDRFVCFDFTYDQYCTGPLEDEDSKISPKPLLELIDNVIASMHFTPSAELQQAIDEVKQQCPDLSMSSECQPLKWPAHVDKDGITIVEYDRKRYPEYI
ncbi:hypothetical protein [Microbulbifer sp.]|uniref:hypothetical protein n=1 Tax=Microbulbifer sp. TaxID=1908541 RepID=UPI00258349BE|nr:hypothetical protein [Microbulbifer sp.]